MQSEHCRPCPKLNPERARQTRSAFSGGLRDKIPGHRRVAPPKHIGAIDERDINEFGSPTLFGCTILNKPDLSRSRSARVADAATLQFEAARSRSCGMSSLAREIMAA